MAKKLYSIEESTMTNMANTIRQVTGATESITGEEISSYVVNNLSNSSNNLVFDTTPTKGSANPVTSGGLFTKFAEQQDRIDTAMAGAYAAMSGALTWDGVIGNKEVIIVESNEEATTGFVHISDEYPEILSLLFADSSELTMPPCTIALSGIFSGIMGVPLMHLPITIYPDGLILANEGMLFLVPSDNYIPPESIGMPFTFPKRGVYFMCMTINEMAAAGLTAPAMYVSALSLAPYHSFADNGGGDASKYFEKIAGYSFGDTLTWDGSTAGRVISTSYTPMEGFTMEFCKISDCVLTASDVIDGYSFTGPNAQTGELITNVVSGEAAQEDFADDGLLDSSTIANIPSDNFVLDEIITFPEAGIYFPMLNGIPMMTSLTVPGYNFEVSIAQEIIKTEHLPEALRFGEIETTIESDTLTWDGNTTGLTDIDGAVYKVSDTIPTLNDIHQGFSLTFSAIDGSDSNTISISAEEAASIQMNDGIILFEVFAIATQPITETKNDGTTITYPAGVYFLYAEDDNVYVSSLTINNYKGFPTASTELVKIDKKYLPDDIGGGLPEVTTNDEGALLRVVNGKWAAVVLPNAEEGEF